MKQQEPCPGCGGNPARWYVRVGRAVMVVASSDSSYLDQEGWIHTTFNCPVWASARDEVLRKKEQR
jgi:hypothetical protein